MRNPLFGFLTSRTEPFKQQPRGKVTYHRSKKADRKQAKKDESYFGPQPTKRSTRGAKKVARIVSAGRKSKPRASDKDILGLFGDMDFDRMDNPLKKGVRGTVRLVGKGRKARLEIYT
jgi:hypothetical protein